MANSLRKYKFTGGSSTSDLKVEILTSLKKDIAVLLRSDLKAVLAEEFEAVKSELHTVKTEVTSNTATIRSEVETMKTVISSCSDDVTSLQTKICKLETEVTNLWEKRLDMDGRMRRSNIQTLNVTETPGSSTPAAVPKLLKEVLNIDKDVLIDRPHRGPQARKPDGKPRVIVAKIHHHQDCATSSAVPGSPGLSSSKKPPSLYSRITLRVLHKPGPHSLKSSSYSVDSGKWHPVWTFLSSTISRHTQWN